MTRSFGLFGDKARTMVGVDIGASTVKVAEVRYASGQFHLLACGSDSLPLTAMNDRQVSEPEEIGKVISRLLRQLNIKSRNAAIAVSGSPVITKTITLPSTLSERDMEEQIRLEADQYVPYPIDEVNLDFTIIGPSPVGEGVNEVLLSACRSETIDERLAAIESAGMTADVVDIEEFALENVMTTLALPAEASGVTMLCEIGATRTLMAVFDGHKPVYRREQGFGGRQLTEDIMRHYGMSTEEAEQAKRSGNLPDDYVQEVLPYFIDDLAQQIDRALQLFFANFNEYSNLDHLLLSGGTACILGLAEVIGDKLGIATSSANPFAQMTIGPNVRRASVTTLAPAMLLAVGLGLRSSDPQ
ncbi:MAG: type IV pilus assembly protein PilM [Oceanococcaceae bacterium]